MQKSPQDIYARHLLSPRGYPLWTPEPSQELLARRRDGLRIGDVGIIIPEDGCFDVFFNLCLPHDHPFHEAHGVPDNFKHIPLTKEDFRTNTNAENPGRIIAASSVNTVAVERSVDASRSSGQEYEFNLSSKEGALLILPEGAERQVLRNYRLFLEAAMLHGADWYRFAEEKVGQIVGHDSLYLITGLHKTLSWSLAAFEEAAGSEVYPAQCKLSQVGMGNITTTCTWNTTRALDWRIGPIDNFGIPNQAVFIRGFKIAQRTGMFGTKRISVRADAPSTRPNLVDYFGAVSSNSWLGYIFGGRSGGRNVGSSRSGTQDEIAKDPVLDSALNEVQNHGALAVGEDVVIHRTPEASQAFHPSDIINQSLLKREPSANIAITHDDAWIALLEKSLLQPEDLVQDDRLQALVFENHDVILEQGAVYLRNSNLVSHLAHLDQLHATSPPGASKDTVSHLVRDHLNETEAAVGLGGTKAMEDHSLESQAQFEKKISVHRSTLELMDGITSTTKNLGSFASSRDHGVTRDPDIFPLLHSTPFDIAFSDLLHSMDPQRPDSIPVASVGHGIMLSENRCSRAQRCHWEDAASLAVCGVLLTCEDVSKHFRDFHNIKGQGEECLFVCRWRGCTQRTLHRRNLARHIREVHLGHARMGNHRTMLDGPGWQPEFPSQVPNRLDLGPTNPGLLSEGQNDIIRGINDTVIPDSMLDSYFI